MLPVLALFSGRVRRGFTLVELLVVIAIIGVLLSRAIATSGTGGSRISEAIFGDKQSKTTQSRTSEPSRYETSVSRKLGKKNSGWGFCRSIS